jgi:hypothetical protein
MRECQTVLSFAPLHVHFIETIVKSDTVSCSL